MKNFLIKITGIIVLFLVLVLNTSFANQGTQIESFISIQSDGLAPFDNNDNPGNDSGRSNNLVRNFDTVVYRSEVSINGANDTNVVSVIKLNNKAEWESLPGLCGNIDGSNPDLSVSEIKDTTGDGLKDTLVCSLGNRTEGTKLIIESTAIAVGNNNEIIMAKVCSNSDNNINNGGENTAQCNKADDVKITANFEVKINKTVISLSDDKKIYYRTRKSKKEDTGREDDGTLMDWHIQLEYSKGSEFIKNNGGLTTFTIKDSWSVIRGNQDGSTTDITELDDIEIYNFGLSGVNGGCFVVNPEDTYTVTCSQPGGPGSDIKIRISDVDIFKRKPFKIGLTMWIPNKNIVGPLNYHDGTIALKNTASIESFEVDGQKIIAPLVSGTQAENNTTLESDDEEFLVSVAWSDGSVAFYKTFDSMGSFKTGARAAAKGEVVETTMVMADHRTYDTRPAVCDIIDQDIFEFAGVDNNQKDAVAHGYNLPSANNEPLHESFNPVLTKSLYEAKKISVVNALKNGIIIEYSDTPNNNNYYDTICDDSNTWVTDYSSLQNGMGSVTKVRMKWNRNLDDMLSNQIENGDNWKARKFRVYFSFNLKVKDNQDTHIGDLLRNIASIARSDYSNNNDWLKAEEYHDFVKDKNTQLYSFNKTIADRVMVIGANMSIDKEYKDIDQNGKTLKQGDSANFLISAKTNGVVDGDIILTIVDNLPWELEYISDNCSNVVSGCVANVDGQQVTWTIPNHISGTIIPTFELEVRIREGAQAGIYTNEVIINSDNPDKIDNNSSEKSLKSYASIIVAADAGIKITKMVTPVLIEITMNDDANNPGFNNNDFTYSLNYTNMGGSFGEGQIIDIMPYNGDGDNDTSRDPVSNFNGSIAFVEVIGSNSETFEYTLTNAPLISHRPCSPSNWPNGDTIETNELMSKVCKNGLRDSDGNKKKNLEGSGGTVWISGLPETAIDRKNLTAIRATVPSFTAGSGSKKIDITLRAINNFEGDRYCNNFGSQFNESLDEISNDVCASVVAGSIAGTVWMDNDKSGGLHNPADNEPVLGGLTIILLNNDRSPVKDIDGNNIEVLTDDNGDYLFSNLGSGEYQVAVKNPPVGFLQTYDHDDGTNAANYITSHNSGVVLLHGPLTDDELVDVSDLPDIDFGYVGLASIGDYVWEDMNANGIQEAGDNGIEGVTVNLLDENGAVVKTITTDTNGKYLFDKLVPGEYQIQFTTPAPKNIPGVGDVAWKTTKQNIGADDAKDSDIEDLATGKTIKTTLTPGENDLTWDAGYYVPPSLGDYVWYDDNGSGSTARDGTQDVGEVPIAGVTVNLLDENGAVLKTITTDGNGYYRFDDLYPATVYNIQAVKPGSSWRFTTSDTNAGNNEKDSDVNYNGFTSENTTLLSSQHYKHLDAGLYNLPGDPPRHRDKAELGDYVWFDTNKNGIQDADEEGVSGIKVELLDKDGNVLKTTKTNSKGKYIFKNLKKGDYHVKFYIPSEYTITKNGNGSDSKNSDINQEGLTEMIHLAKNGSEMTWDAGIYKEVVEPPVNPPKTTDLIDLELTKTVNKKVLRSSESLIFTKYLHYGSRGEEVKNVQRFLTEQGLYNGPISGYYGPLTMAAVKKFQNKHADQILKPWGIPCPCGTGYWYKSTLHYANEISKITTTEDTVRFTLTVVNKGPGDATRVGVIDTLATAYTNPRNFSDANTVVAGNSILWAIPSIKAGESYAFSFDVDVKANGGKLNVAEIVMADQKDIDSTPNNHVLTEDDYDTALVRRETASVRNNTRPPLNDPVKRGMTSIKKCIVNYKKTSARRAKGCKI